MVNWLPVTFRNIFGPLGPHFSICLTSASEFPWIPWGNWSGFSAQSKNLTWTSLPTGRTWTSPGSSRVPRVGFLFSFKWKPQGLAVGYKDQTVSMKIVSELDGAERQLKLLQWSNSDAASDFSIEHDSSQLPDLWIISWSGRRHCIVLTNKSSSKNSAQICSNDRMGISAQSGNPVPANILYMNVIICVQYV